MKLEEAKKLVGQMIDWAMLHEGISVNPEPINATLEEMCKANRIVELNNKKVKSKDSKRVFHMVLDERLIAALYVAMSYTPSKESIICHKKNYVFVVKE